MSRKNISENHPKSDQPGPPQKTQEQKKHGLFTRSEIVSGIVSGLVVSAITVGVQFFLDHSQENRTNQLENLRFVRENSGVDLPLSDSPHCVSTSAIQAPTVKKSAESDSTEIPNRPFRAMDLRKQNLSGLWLTCADFEEANLEQANLKGAYLVSAKLTRANLAGADLTGTALTNASLIGADLTGANLSGAYLEGVNLTGANLKEVNIADAEIKGVWISGDDPRLTQEQKEQWESMGATLVSNP